MSSLETLNLGYNVLYDDIGAFAPLTGIKNLILEKNSFYGELDPDFLFAWRQIETLDVSDNLIKGKIPENLFDRPHLEIIDLHGNFFIETLPDDISPESLVVFLALQDNQLTGSIARITTHLRKLKHLDLSNNGFSGVMPEFDQLTGLKYLFLSKNPQFTAGSIPASIANLPELEDLALQGTSRTGNIPQGFGSRKDLTLLDLSYNELEGEIPSAIGNATKLKFLFLNRNKLSGSIPKTFTNLKKMRTLLLDKNDLIGGAKEICEAGLPNIQDFIADCLEVQCDPNECCTLCCKDEVADGEADTCNDMFWNGEIDPVGEYEYRRGVYKFHDDDIKFPVQAANDHDFQDTSYSYGEWDDSDNGRGKEP